MIIWLYEQTGRSLAIKKTKNKRKLQPGQKYKDFIKLSYMIILSLIPWQTRMKHPNEIIEIESTQIEYILKETLTSCCGSKYCCLHLLSETEVNVRSHNAFNICWFKIHLKIDTKLINNNKKHCIVTSFSHFFFNTLFWIFVYKIHIVVNYYFKI